MTAKEQVLKVYPDAYSEHVCNAYWAINSDKIKRKRLGFGESESAAWQSALTKINENGTTSNTTKEMV